jgi:glycosyltransferase involved in cell wall biosynthesis
MKIVHVLAPAEAGGLERVVHALAIGQHRRGDTVTVAPIVEAWSDNNSFNVPLARAGVDVRPLVVPPRAYRRERAVVRAVLRELKPDVMHSHGYRPDVVSGGVARSEGVATVSTAHGFTRGPWRNRLYEALDRRALRRFDAVTVVSRPLANELVRSGLSTDRVHVIPNAWSSISTPLERDQARRELGLGLDDFVAGWVGRMTAEKGLDVFADALLLLADQPIVASIIGAGPGREREETRITAANPQPRVRWAGLVQEAGRYFKAFDVLVLSSRTEGVPMVVLEAMASRVPLVVTAVGGIPDVVSPNEARLVPSEHPEALAEAIKSVLDDRNGAMRRVAAAAERLEREFAETPWLSRYDAVYREAADR